MERTDLGYKIKIAKRKLFWKLKGHPIWAKYPDDIQIDTHNFCNLECEYCNVKTSGCYRLPRGKMKTELFEALLKELGKKLYWSVALFMNGEPLLDDRLPVMCDMVKQYTDTMCIFDTNGTLWEKKHFLVHPNLKLVRFTISAATPETYETVHGKPYFHRAMATVHWFMRNKLPTQNIHLHFIVTPHNVHEIEKWIKLFPGVRRTVFPVHRVPLFQKNSEACVTNQLSKPFFVDANNMRANLWVPNNQMMKYYPCPCWGILGVGWNGEIMQCCDMPYKYNYGKVGEISVFDAWQERLKNKMDNDCCRDCKLKFPHWKKMLDKYVK